MARFFGKAHSRMSLSGLRTLWRFGKDRRGATAIEYGLIVALIFLAIVGAMASTGNGVSDRWNSLGEKVLAALQ
jgi:pilus assembly protein Flp/PilA